MNLMLADENRCLLAFLIAVLLGGCGTTEVTPPQLKDIVNTDPLDHCVYVGSDDVYHYFERSRAFGAHRYQVKKERMRLDKIFPVGKGEPYVIYKQDVKACDPNQNAKRGER